MRRIPRALLLAAVVATPATLAGAQVKPVKDAAVYLKVPTELFGVKKEGQKWSWEKREVLVATVEARAEGGAAINGDPSWRLRGFPPLIEIKVAKAKPQEVELKTVSGASIKLLFPKGDAETLFPRVVSSKAELDGYRAETYKLLGDKFFNDTPLATLPEDRKSALVLFAHLTAKGTTMGTITYKDNVYFRVDVGTDDNVYNELKLNQSQRVSRVLTERLLTLLKAFAAPVAGVKEVYGLKIEMGIPHKSFADQYASASVDKLELYAPSELIKTFSDADITSQQFIDGCVVIVEGNRVSVALTAN